MKMHGVDFSSNQNDALLPKIQDEAQRLNSLLESPEFGLISWNKCLLERLQSLQGYIAGVLGLSRPVKFMELDYCWDPFSTALPDGRSFRVRVVDITGLCPLHSRNITLIFYYKDGRMGVVVHDGMVPTFFWMDELDTELSKFDCTVKLSFAYCANERGLSGLGLRAIIEKYKP